MAADGPRPSCLERLRECHREVRETKRRSQSPYEPGLIRDTHPVFLAHHPQIAKYSDPQSAAEYEALIATLYSKAKAHRGLQQPQQEEVCARAPCL